MDDFVRYAPDVGVTPHVVFLEDGPWPAGPARARRPRTVVEPGRFRHVHRNVAAFRLRSLIARERPDVVMGWLARAHVTFAAAVAAGLRRRLAWYQWLVAATSSSAWPPRSPPRSCSPVRPRAAGRRRPCAPAARPPGAARHRAAGVLDGPELHELRADARHPRGADRGRHLRPAGALEAPGRRAGGGGEPAPRGQGRARAGRGRRGPRPRRRLRARARRHSRALGSPTRSRSPATAMTPSPSLS